MKRIFLALLILMVVFMQQSYADDGSGRQVLELMFSQDEQSKALINTINVSEVQNGNLQRLDNDHYLIWNNNQANSLYQVTLYLKNGEQLIFYLNPFYDDYHNDYSDFNYGPYGIKLDPSPYGYSWMLGIWNSQKKSINQPNGNYQFKAYLSRYFLNNSVLGHTAVNIYESVFPVVHGNWYENNQFMSANQLPSFNACNKGIYGNISNDEPECMLNPEDNKRYIMDRVQIDIHDLYVKNAKEYLVGFANNNGMISWQQKTEDDYSQNGSSNKKIYFQASYNQQPFCKVYMSDDLSKITSVGKTQYAPVACDYKPDDYEPSFVFACTGSSSLGLANNNQNACGWVNSGNLQSQAFSSNINQL